MDLSDVLWDCGARQHNTSTIEGAEDVEKFLIFSDCIWTAAAGNPEGNLDSVLDLIVGGARGIALHYLWFNSVCMSTLLNVTDKIAGAVIMMDLWQSCQGMTGRWLVTTAPMMKIFTYALHLNTYLISSPSLLILGGIVKGLYTDKVHCLLCSECGSNTVR